MEKISPYIWTNGVLAGLISLLHSFEAFRCIGWSVSAVYKVRDYEFGDPGLWRDCLVAEGGWVGRLYLPTFPFGPGKSSLYGG